MAHLELSDVAKAIAARILPFSDFGVSKLAYTVVWHLRLPRILMSVIAGAGLAISGVAMQGITRNPLFPPSPLAFPQPPH